MQQIIMVVLYVGLYALISYSFQKMAQKLNIEDAWLVWIPVVNIFMLIKMAGKSYWWILALFVPIMNIIAMFVIFIGIAKRLNRSAWMGVLMLIPFVNLIAIPYLAFSDDGLTVPQV